MNPAVVPILLLAVAAILGTVLARLLRALWLARADASVEHSLLVGAGAPRAHLLAALAVLQQRPVAASLVALPWRLVLGAEAAGKSEWLARSGQRFAAPGAALGEGFVGAGPTRALRWWPAAEGITLERGGRALAPGQPDAEAAWNGFIETLARARGGRAFDTVIVVLGADRLLAASPEALESLAHQVGARWRECARPGMTPPDIQLLLQRMDRLAGFSDFFSMSSPDAAWAVRDTSTGGALTERLSRLWRGLELPIRARRLDAVADAEDGPARARSFCYPEQLARLHAPLERFVTALFASGEPDPARWRALAACSARAAGEVEDHVRVPIASELGLKPHLLTPPPGEGETRLAAGAFRALAAR